MKFELFIQGVIPPHKRGIANEKMSLRMQLSPQIAAIWNTRQMLGLKEYALGHQSDDEPPAILKFGDVQYIPLVSRKLKLVARLDITYYQFFKEERLAKMRSAADLDNRTKTLIDALRCPQNKSEAVVGSSNAKVDCLLEDDSLVVETTSRASRMYSGDLGRDCSLTRIEVDVFPSVASMKNIGLIGEMTSLA